MESQERLLHELLKMGEMMFTCGAEINRVEDTMSRLARAYGAARADIFAITLTITLTILFEDGAELTQTRRILREPSMDFDKLERLNALSRSLCAAPIPVEDLHRALIEIDRMQPRGQKRLLGSVMMAAFFTVFLGGTWLDGLIAAAVGALVCFLQRRVAPVFRNPVFFQLLAGLIAGGVICLVGRLTAAVGVGQISIGVIMLLIPGAALTNAVREVMVGNTISGLLRLAESLLLALMLAIGFGSAMYLLGV